MSKNPHGIAAATHFPSSSQNGITQGLSMEGWKALDIGTVAIFVSLRVPGM